MKAWLPLVLALLGCSDRPVGVRATLDVAQTLGGLDTEGFARAVEHREFSFPADHGPHREFKTEWWYITGNLEAYGGREVGFQFTVFRSSLAPDSPVFESRVSDSLVSESAWATNQAYMAHLAVTDVEGEEFHAFDRFARGSIDLAGAESAPFRVWVEDWILAATASDRVFPMRLRAAESGVSLDLTFEAGKVRVLQGDQGLSQKGPREGNASYYYSHTRMPTVGRVVLGGDTLSVTGEAWLDREWSTSALADGLVGWDWFALQLDNGWDLMLYGLRGADGSIHGLSDGVMIDPRGNRIELEWGQDLFVNATGSWTSPVDGTQYPSGWRIRSPERGWDIQVDPVLEDQELNLTFRYWEGAVRVTGSAEGQRITGKGYVELTGYSGRPPGR